MFDNSTYDLDAQSETVKSNFKRYVLKTFATMAIGLLITVISSLIIINTGFIYTLFEIPMFPLILIVAQLGVVMAFSARLFKASVTTARAMFIAYSILVGVTFSVLGLVYTSADISLAFIVTCIYFGSLVAIGYTTKIDLTRFAPIFFIGLIILIIFNVIAAFTNISGMDMIACSLGLILFTGITAYDAQKMKRLYMENEGNETVLQRLSLYSALDLYLDFINIFIYILRILGRRN